MRLDGNVMEAPARIRSIARPNASVVDRSPETRLSVRRQLGRRIRREDFLFERPLRPAGH